MRYSTFFLSVIISLSALCQEMRFVPYSPGVSTNSNFVKTIEYAGDLYFGGRITLFNDSTFYGLVRMDPSGAVSQIGPFNSTPDDVKDMIIYQGKLIISYALDNDDRVASWDGVTWDTLGTYFDRDIRSLEVYNGQLIAGGEFEEYGVNGDTLLYIAQWTGTTWTQFGSAPNRDVNAIEVHNSTLYMGGEFNQIGNDSVAFIAYWNGLDWEQLGVGLEDDVNNMLSTPDGLILDGDFNGTSDGTVVLNRIANWDNAAFTVVPGAEFNNHSLLNINGYGYGISDGFRTIIDPYDAVLTLKQNALTNGSLYNGDIVVINQNPYPSYEEISEHGKLISGSDCSSLNMAGVSISISALADFEDPINDISQFEIPAGSGRKTLFFSSVYAVGMSGNQLFTSGTGYPDTDPALNTFRAGPRANQTDMQYNERYHQVWKIDNGLVWDHIANWNTPGYQAPYGIENYPGNGDPMNGESFQLAPFSEDFPNGSYEPDLGDYPVFKGDAALFTIRSDEKMETQGLYNPVGIDIVSQTYTYDVVPADPRYQVVFSEKRITNRSGRDYDSLFIGFFLDFDIGGYEDDYVGTDSALNLIYGYNGDNADADGIALGYGAAPPAQGFKILNQSLFSSNTHVGQPLSLENVPDTVWEHRVLGKTDFGGDIVSPINGPTRFIYGGDPNDLATWSEVSLSNMVGDRRMISSVGPFLNVQDGDDVCIEVAHIFARDSVNNTNLTNVTLLKQRATALQNWYDLNSPACGNYVPLAVDDANESIQELSIYPNPNNGEFLLSGLEKGNHKLSIFDLNGRLVQHQTIYTGISPTPISSKELVNGSYFLSVQSESSTIITIPFVVLK